MHELLLFAQVPAKQHYDLAQQLAGVTAMQPTHIFERHLIFRAYRKPGFVKPRPGGSQDVQATEVQKLNKLLAGGLYYIQAVGEVLDTDFGSKSESDGANDTTGTSQKTTSAQDAYVSANQSWRVEFKDIPDAGARSGVTSRLVGSAKIAGGDLLTSMNAWGFE